jgi:hypothetical protein
VRATLSLTLGLAAVTASASAQTWIDQVQAIRIQLAAAGAPAMVEALQSGDDMRVFAALSMEYADRVRYERQELASVLASTGNREVAKGAAILLARRDTPEATRALVDHVRIGGPAQKAALEHLRRRSQGQDKDALLKIAAQPREDAASMAAILGLAFIPGRDVTVTLHRLRNDWAQGVQRAAEDALVLRRRLGMDTKAPYRAPPVGKRPEEVAYVPGTEADPNYVPPAPPENTGEYANEVPTEDLVSKAREAKARLKEIEARNKALLPPQR